MVTNLLYPSHVVIGYHSLHAAHKMTIPTLEWQASPNVGGAGSFPQHDTGTVDADAMISGLCTAIAAILSEDVTFDDYVIYHWPTEDGPPNPVASKILGIPGEVATPYVPAATSTFNFRTAEFGNFKLVICDTIPPVDFKPNLPADLSPGQQGVIDVLMDTDFAWVGRDTSAITQFIRITNTINDRLHRSYRYS